MQSKITIYQIFTRLFGNCESKNKPFGTIEENGVGKFNDITDKALAKIKKLGITHIWYTGIIEHAVVADYGKYGIKSVCPALVKGRAGSPYAIKDYYDVNPDLAVNIPDRMAEFEELVLRTHKNGMKVIIDFVPNHVARQYCSETKPDDVENLGKNDDTSKSFSSENNFYYLPDEKFSLPDNINRLKNLGKDFPKIKYSEYPAKATGNDKFVSKPEITDWYETVKLNYGIDYLNNKKKHFVPIPDTWKKMLDILFFWAGKKVDGFRCDMAEMVPVEFWNYAILQVKEKYPEIIFIAEIYNPLEYHNYINIGRFDFLYDKAGLYDTLKNIITNNGSATLITNCWQILEGIDVFMLRFLENHDEVRLASKYFAGHPQAGIPAMTVAACLNKGPVMLYFGQEVGENAVGNQGFSSDNGRTSIYDYTHVPEHQKWMNFGKFDGGLLSQDQKELRSFYKKLLNFCINEKAITEGKFYDLMWANFNKQTFNSKKVYCFLRYTDNRKLLFVVNFDKEQQQNVRVIIPEHAFSEMNISDKEFFSAREILFGNNNFSFDKETAITKGIRLLLKPWDAQIIEF